VTLVYDQEPPRFTVLGWRVTDIEAVMADLAARGVEFKRYEGYPADEKGIWIAPNGNRIAWFEDPDGNIIALQQRPA
jgi:catechol 2,3-dioxygenase-like lactoylglutathione lyase family enzyme